MFETINNQTINMSLQANDLAKINQSMPSTKKQSELMEAAQNFEAVFINQMMNIMDSTVEKSDFLRGGKGEEIFKKMMNQNISVEMAKNPASSFGLAKQIYEQMKDKV